MDIKIGEDEEESFTKKPSVIEEVAFRDTWGNGTDSFVSMIYERLKLMYDLLAEDGSIYVHCDGRVSAYIKLALDEIFGTKNYRNEIIWKRSTNISSISNIFRKAHDTIFYYSKSEATVLNKIYKEHSDDYLSQYNHNDKEGNYRHAPLLVSGKRNGSTGSVWRGFDPNTFGRNGMHWITKIEKLEKLDAEGKVYWPKNGQPMLKYYFDDNKGVPASDIWDDVNLISPTSAESENYPTQKPESLIERIIKASSNEGDLVADFFCGSGTTLSVSEKLGRKWIGSDLGKFGVHTSRKRMIGVQRELKKEGKNFRAFEILNVGRYERENFISTNNDLRAEEKAKQIAKKEKAFVSLILSAYKAEPVESFDNFVGKKRDRLVAIGPINLPVSSKFINFILEECIIHKITKVDVLGFDYEMGLDFSKSKDLGIDIEFKVIPREVFDKRAVERGQVKFYDVAFIECKPIVSGKGTTKELSIELTDFSVFYNQDNTGEIEQDLRAGGTKVVVENGQVIKISKDKKTEIVTREVLTKKWSDWIDYWAVDYDFASRKEIIKVIEKGEEKEVWTGDYIFDNEWQEFRTKKKRNLELVSAPKELPKGKYKVAVKVVDIFGNDTTRVIDVKI